PATIATAMATARLGGIHVPLRPSWGETALKHRLARVRPSVVVVDQANRAMLASLGLDARTVIASGPGYDGDTPVVRLSAGDPVPSVQPIDGAATALSLFPFDPASKNPPVNVVHRILTNLTPFVDDVIAAEASDDVVLSLGDPGSGFGLLTTGIAVLERGITR